MGLVVISILTLLVTCFAVLASAAAWAWRWVLSTIWYKFESHIFSWPEFSDTAIQLPGTPQEVRFTYRRTPVAVYRSPEPSAAEEECRCCCCCCFCLCPVEEGEEFRELRCNHIFHRVCLDRWVDYGRAECPLCRESLITASPVSADSRMTLPCVHGTSRLPA